MAEQLALLHNLFSDSNFTLKFANEKTSLTNSASPPYHESEAIYLSSQSLQWINDKKLNVFGVNHA
ncbi:hypothetical protein [Wolbachia endosymbiont of Dactylopius coccus]